MKILASMLLGVPVLMASPARAAELCPLVADLNRMLVAETEYQEVPCPEIGFSALDNQPGMRSQAGAYFPDTGKIELAPDLDLATAYGQSCLLHELVHAAQFAEGADRSAPCPAALEAEAYRVQAHFLHEAGHTRDALLTRMLGDQLGTCSAGPDY